MPLFRRTRKGVRAQFDAGEIDLLVSLSSQLRELLTEATPVVNQPASAAGDPFERWEAQFAELAPPPREELDPVLQRLFPDAYPDDPQAAAEFARLSRPTQRDDRLASIETVVSDLGSADRSGRFIVAEGHLFAWLTTLNAIRLSLSVRLDITDEDSFIAVRQLPDDDPRVFLYAVFTWLGYVLQEVVEAFEEPD